MGLANRLNRRSSTVMDGINTKELDYYKSSDYAGTVSEEHPIILRGFFFQTGKYGESITLVCEMRPGNYFGLNVPKRYVDMFKEYTPEEVEEIKAGKLGIVSIEKAETANGPTYFYELKDL